MRRGVTSWRHGGITLSCHCTIGRGQAQCEKLLWHIHHATIGKSVLALDPPLYAGGNQVAIPLYSLPIKVPEVVSLRRQHPAIDVHYTNSQGHGM